MVKNFPSSRKILKHGRCLFWMFSDSLPCISSIFASVLICNIQHTNWLWSFLLEQQETAALATHILHSKDARSCTQQAPWLTGTVTWSIKYNIGNLIPFDYLSLAAFWHLRNTTLIFLQHTAFLKWSQFGSERSQTICSVPCALFHASCFP